MGGRSDDGHLDNKLKKDDNPAGDNDDGPNPEEIDIEEKNPFQVQVILDVMFKMLSFEEVKKFRHVSLAWDEVGFSELSKRTQKPIKFHDTDELQLDDKLGELVQIQIRHNEVFPDLHHHQIFSNFSFKIFLLTCHQIDQFFTHFSPKVVELYGDHERYIPAPYEQTDQRTRKEKDDELVNFYKIFLQKISPSVEEINYNQVDPFYDNHWEKDYVQEGSLTPYPNLRKISIYNYWTKLSQMFFYPLVGQNSPKLSHLEFGHYLQNESLGSREFIKEIFERSDLLSKIKYLKLSDVDKDPTDPNEELNIHLLKVLTDFGQNGQLKLTKLNFENQNLASRLLKWVFVRLISTQAESLKILRISTSFSNSGFTLPSYRISFPALKNLTSLQIDSFSRFGVYFEPINFSQQFPKLVKFNTFDAQTFFNQNLGQDGDSVKSVSFLKDSSQDISNHLPKLILDHVYQIFPNLEFLQVDFDFLPKVQIVEDVEIWSKLKKVVIHCSKFKNLLEFDVELLQVIRRLEIVVHCEDILTDEDFYRDYLGRIMTPEYDGNPITDHFTRQKLYQKFLNAISNVFNSLQSSFSFTIIGYKISENFKRDFKAIFPDSTFICRTFKSAYNN